MNRTKRIFLTTVNETKDRLDILYFANENESGMVSYTTGISVAEAGIKYILSKYMIDEIIVLGPSSFAGAGELGERVIEDVPIDNIADLSGMSEYGFLCYRIKEFMDQMDLEILDIDETVPEDTRGAFNEEIKNFRSTCIPDTGLKKMFVKLSSDDEAEKLFSGNVLEGRNASEKRWIKHRLFSQMDSFYKIHMMGENRNTTIRFMPVETRGVIELGSLTDIVYETLSGRDEDIDLYMDIQGMNAVDGNTLISTFLLMNKRIGYNCSVRELIKSEYDPGRFCGRIWNVRESYEIQKLISGVDIFLEYGKDDQLKQYWDTLGTDDPDADILFSGMDMVDEGITLCNIDLISCGIDIIRKVIKKPEPERGRSIYLDIIMNAIKADYGAMLDGDELSIPELLKWSLRKGLYQQTLTIIESKVPEDMVRRAIYYYAENEGDIRRMMKAINVIYWNEPARMRYSFNDIDHYFIKFYGRFVLDYRQKPDAVARDYAQLRVDVLKGPQGVVQRAFSQLHDDELLFELLYCYYQIGNLRNQVNHALVDRAAVTADGYIRHKDSRKDLKVELGRFIELYDTACRKVKKTREPLILESRRFKGYARYHELQPLETENDFINESHYVCSFDGKDVLIRINMLSPEADHYDEDDSSSTGDGSVC